MRPIPIRCITFVAMLVLGCEGPGVTPPPTCELEPMPDVGAVPEGAVCDFRGGAGVAGPDFCSGGMTYRFVVDTIENGREQPPGTTAGFDLDRHVSDDSDPCGCYQPDYLSLDGTPGVDNQMALLLPTIEAALQADVALAQRAAIDEGRSLVVIELRHVHSLVDDDCVDVSVLEADLPARAAQPSFDEDGRLRVGQTLAVRRDTERRFIEGRLEAGRLSARSGGFPTRMPPASRSEADESYYDIRGARLEATLVEDRLVDAVVGGAVRLETLRAVATCIGLEDEFARDTIHATLESVADLRRDADGHCNSLSQVLEFSAVAFEAE